MAVTQVIGMVFHHLDNAEALSFQCLRDAEAAYPGLGVRTDCAQARECFVVPHKRRRAGRFPAQSGCGFPRSPLARRTFRQGVGEIAEYSFCRLSSTGLRGLP